MEIIFKFTSYNYSSQSLSSGTVNVTDVLMSAFDQSFTRPRLMLRPCLPQRSFSLRLNVKSNNCGTSCVPFN